MSEDPKSAIEPTTEPTTEPTPSSTPPIRWPAVLRAWVVSALWVGLPFLGLVIFLLLHRAGVVGRVNGIAYERTLVLDLLILWVLVAGLLALVRHRRPVLDWLGSQKAQVALLLFTLLFCFAFMEAALRILRPEAAAQPFRRLPSETLHHRNAPDRSSLGMGNKRVETNEHGFRTPYSLADFQALDHRVVLLGDSYVFGLGVDGEAAVASVLEEGLRRNLEAVGRGGESVGVLNTGVISYSPLLEKLAFRRVVKEYRPTLTLLLVDANDIGDDHQYANEIVPGTEADPRFDVPPLEDSEPSLCQRSAVCKALGPLWDRLFAKPRQVLTKVFGLGREAYDYYAFEVEVGGKKETDRFFILRHPLDETRPYFDTTWGHVEEAAEEARESGSDFVLVIMPRYFHWNDAECPDNWEKDRYGVDEPHENAFLEYFDQRSADAPFPVWSLLEPFLAAEGPLVFDHDPHWNDAGHRVAGEALADWLAEAGWPGGIEGTASRRSFPPQWEAGSEDSAGDEEPAEDEGPVDAL